MTSRVAKSFHSTIIKTASQKLGRELTAKEMKFITSREGFVALEMISDTVKSGAKEEIERYLNSE